MSITDELREYAGSFYLFRYKDVREMLDAIADRIDAEHEKACDEAWNNGYEADYLGIGKWLTEHPQAMEHHGWVRGPLDSDGEIWHSGDMSDSNWGVIEGIAYDNGTWYISGHDTSAPWIRADSIRHYHEPTVEDLLREMADRCYADEEEPRDRDAIVAEFAAKLRLVDDWKEQ